MNTFLEYIFSFPIIAFTVPLIIMMIFWIFALLRIIDIEILDCDIDTDSSDTEAPSFFASLGLGGLPFAVSITLLGIYAFVFAFLGKQFVTPLFEAVLTATASNTVTAIFALILAIPFAAYTSKPLKQVFMKHEAIEKSDIVGTYCIVITQTVTESFGQARADDGMTYNVRTTSDHQIAGGSTVVLTSFNEADNTYTALTEAELMVMAPSPPV